LSKYNHKQNVTISVHSITGLVAIQCERDCQMTLGHSLFVGASFAVGCKYIE